MLRSDEMASEQVPFWKFRIAGGETCLINSIKGICDNVFGYSTAGFMCRITVHVAIIKVIEILIVHALIPAGE